MITDKNMTFLKGTDAPVSVTKALPLGQGDLSGDTSGMGPYAGLYVYVATRAALASLSVTLEHCDSADGAFKTLTAYPEVKEAKAGDAIVKAPLPFSAKNWVRLKFDSAVSVDAMLLLGVDKGVLVND